MHLWKLSFLSVLSRGNDTEIEKYSLARERRLNGMWNVGACCMLCLVQLSRV